MKPRVYRYHRRMSRALAASKSPTEVTGRSGVTSSKNQKNRTSTQYQAVVESIWTASTSCKKPQVVLSENQDLQCEFFNAESEPVQVRVPAMGLSITIDAID